MPSKLSIDGIDVFIEGQGNDIILMIHGWPDTYEIWDRQVDALKGKHCCVRFTLPGFSHNDEKKAWNLAELTQLIKKIIERVSPEKAVTLMIHDWGSVFGYHFYNQNPTLVSKVISVDIGDLVVWQKNSAVSVKIMVFLYQIFLALAWKINGRIGDSMTRFLAKLFESPTPAEKISAKMNYPYFLHWFGGKDHYKKHIKAFNPDCPCLFIFGDDKPFMFHDESWAKQLADKPGNRVLSFKTSHWVMNEAPEEFNQAILDWLQSSAG